MPGDMRAVGHREVGLVVAGDRLLATKYQASLRCLVAKAAREHLVHADAALEYGPFLQRGAGKNVARLSWMNADPSGILVEQTRDNVEPGLVRRQGFEALAQFHIRAGGLGPPMLGVDAVAHEERGE